MSDLQSTIHRITSSTNNWPTPELIGYSHQGCPLDLFCVGPNSAPLRILVVACQHGDEALTSTAALNFIQPYLCHPPFQGKLQVAVVPSLNPDGRRIGQRHNAAGLDLNRDHQLLNSAEVRALHRFVRRWQPHLVVDVHTYPPRRKHLLAQNLIYAHDLFIDGPTNPAIDTVICKSGEVLTATLIKQLSAQGVSVDRYTLINTKGRVRHSTPDVVDLRNGLALMHGCLTLLLEAQQPRGRDVIRAHQIITAIQSALEQIMSWAVQHEELLIAPPLTAQLGQLVSLRSKYVRASSPRTMEFINTATGKQQSVSLPGKYTPQLKTTMQVALPFAYAIPKQQQVLLEFLSRYGFATYNAPRARNYCVEHYRITNHIPSTRSHRAPRTLQTQSLVASDQLREHILVPVNQPGGQALAVLLEPHSKYGLIRYPELFCCSQTAQSIGPPLSIDTFYPIARVLY